MSIPQNTEKVNEWYLVHESDRPATTDTQRLVYGPIKMQNNVCVQTWKIENLSEKDIEKKMKEIDSMQKLINAQLKVVRLQLQIMLQEFHLIRLM